MNRMRNLFLLGAVLLCSLAETRAQHRPTEGMTTTDDPRRVPIPPRDRSKDPVLVLRGGTLIDATAAPPLANAVLVIQGDRILDVGPQGKVTLPANVERTIDVSGLYVLPGLVDLHMHFTQQRGGDFSMYRDSDAAAAIRGVKLLEQFLDGGITAVRDVGTRGDVALKIKEAVERGIFSGPRVFWSGQMVVARGGHADEITSTATGRPKSLESGPDVRVANGPDDWRLAVREQIRMGADWIKVTAPYTRAEVAAAVDEAHLHGIRVAADAFGDFITWAAEAGLDTLEHPLAIPESALEAMARKGTAFVPTMTAFYNVIKYGYPSAGIPPGGFYFTMSRRYPVTHEGHLRSLSKAREMGIKIGVGTDIPFENEKRYPGDYWVELGIFKEAGFTDAEIVAAATRVSADILDVGDKLGTLEKGKVADVLVVSGNPLADYRNLSQMRLVVADGRVVRDKLSGTSRTTTPQF